MKRALSLSVLFSLIIVLASCGSAKHSGRKCDGRKGQKTPMGLI